jgi:hypothetical protein
MSHVSRRQLLAVSGGLPLLFAAPAFGQSAGAADTPEGLKQTIAGIYEAARAGDEAKADTLIRALVLPRYEAWFKRVFGDAKGSAIAAEYADLQRRFQPDLIRLFQRVVADGRSDIQVLRFDRPGSPEAVGLQNQALAAMQNPQPLYSVRFIKPGEQRGMHVYSFAYADGAFRLVGRMSAAQPPREGTKQ